MAFETKTSLSLSAFRRQKWMSESRLFFLVVFFIAFWASCDSCNLLWRVLVPTHSTHSRGRMFRAMRLRKSYRPPICICRWWNSRSRFTTDQIAASDWQFLQNLHTPLITRYCRVVTCTKLTMLYITVPCKSYNRGELFKFMEFR